MSMVAGIKYMCPWSGCEWSKTFPYNPPKGIYPDPPTVEYELRAHIEWMHGGQIPEHVSVDPLPLRVLDVRDPRCCTPDRYGQPCIVHDPTGPVRACKFCDRPM